MGRHLELLPENPKLYPLSELRESGETEPGKLRVSEVNEAAEPLPVFCL